MTYRSPTLSSDENVINILVIQQNDNNVPMLQQALILSDGTQVADSQRPLTLAVSPALSDGTSRGSMSSCQSQDELPSYSWFKRAPKANSTPRPSMYKSQSFTVGQCEVNSQYPDLHGLMNMSGYSNNSITWDRSTLNNQMKTKNELLCPSQLSFSADTKFPIHRDNKKMKCRSVNIPVNHSGVGVLSPDLLVKTLGQSTINSLVATPDSGFCTPGSSTIEESLSGASPLFSTPKRFKFGVKRGYADVESPTAVDKVLVEGVDHEDSALDRSLNSVNWLQTFSVGNPGRPLISSVSNLTTKPASQAFCHDQTWVVKSAPPATTNVLTVTLPPVTPLINFTPVASGSQQAMSALSPLFITAPMASGSQQVMSAPPSLINITSMASGSQLTMSTPPCNPQKRKVLQELNSNICYNPVTRTQPENSQCERPSYSYMDLIKMALKQSDDGQLTLKEILAWIEDHYPFFKYKAKQSWKSSVRCNLSLHPDFAKVEDRKRGGKWKCVDAAKCYMHRLPKPPVIKQPIGPKVPAVTRLKSRRSGPLPILPKSVPYALVPLSLTTLEQSSQTQNIHDQALQILQQHQRPAVLQPLQVQQIFHNQQPQAHMITSQHLFPSVSSANSQPTKVSFQQIAPKLNLNPTLVWNPTAFIMSSYKDGGQSANARVESPPVSDRSVNQRPGNVNTSPLNVTLDIAKQGLDSRSTISDHVLQPMDIQIQQGNLSNEKKIVFILKQQKQEKPVSEVPASITTGYSSPCLIGNNELLKINSAAMPSKGICKTVDGIQRSKSDVVNRSTGVIPYCRRKREDSVKRAPVVNLEHLLKGEKPDEAGVARIFLTNDDDDDDDSELMVDFSSNFCHSSKISVAPRSESAPAKCLIQQAWDQASTLSEAGVSDGHFLDSHSSGGHENSDHHVHSTDIDQTGFSNLVLPKMIAVSAASQSQQNEHYVASSNFQALSKGFDNPTIHTPTSCHTKTYNTGNVSKVCRDASSKNENIKKKKVSSRRVNLSNEKPQTIHADKSWKFKPVDNVCQMKNNQIQIPVIAENPASARKIIFHGVSNSQTNFDSLSSASAINPVAAVPLSSSKVSLCEHESTSQATTTCPPHSILNRTKSRRKQIHTPLSIDSFAERDTAFLESTTNVRNNHLKAASGVGLPETAFNSENVFLCLTPPSGTQQTSSHATSSPNSDHSSPMDFAAFLSTLSTSPCLSLCGDAAVPSVTQEAFEFIPHRSSSSIQPSKSNFCIDLTSSSSTTSSSSGISVSLSPPASGVIGTQDSAAVESREGYLPPASSAVRRTNLTPLVATSSSHFLHSDLSFHSSTAPSNANLNESLLLTPSGHFDNFLYCMTPPVGSRPVPTTSTSAYGMPVLQENLQVRSNSSGILDSSLFDTLDYYMQN